MRQESKLVCEIFSDRPDLGKLSSFYIPGADWRDLISRYNSVEMPSKSAQGPAKHAFRTIVLLREHQIADQFRTAFENRYLPEHLFYWLPSSVQAWVDLCRSNEYKNASRAIEVLKLAAPDLARKLSQILTLCGLGCGEGGKDRVLLEQFAHTGRRLNYLAADFSQPLLERAADQVNGIAEASLGCKLDIFDDDHLDTVVRLAHDFNGAVLFTVLGNTLGAFDSTQFPRRLRSLMHRGDRLLVDGELFGSRTLAGYDNPTNLRFAWGPLAGVGLTENDGKLEFSIAKLSDDLFAVTKHFTAARDLLVNVGSHSVKIPVGEKMRMSGSIKYANREALLKLIQTAGLRIESEWQSSDGNFMLVCASCD